MKSLFVTALFFAAAFAAYDYFGAPVGQKLLFKHLNAVAPSAPESTTLVEELPPVEVAPVASPARDEVAASPVVTADAAAPTAPPAPPPTTPVEKAPVTEANGFTPPNFETIEALTANWSSIPPSAFPRPVTLLKDALFKMSVGGATIKAGAKATALSLQGSQLMLAPTETSAARAMLPIDDTDLKASITSGYERWKVARVTALRRLHERKLAEAANANSSAPTAAPGSVDPAGKPIAGVDGSFPLLIAHLKSGAVTELLAENIRTWSEAVPFMHQGKPAWSVKVSAEVNTLFGLQPVEIMAVVRDGRVEGWYYTGTGEPVP
jgi:hypothetical protein